jgi:alpha-L-fucosidase
MNRTILSLLALTLCFSIQAQAADTASEGRAIKETPAQYNARMKWWCSARFGMFIHWGLYSEAAGYWNGKPIFSLGEATNGEEAPQGYVVNPHNEIVPIAEWIMNDMHIPRSQYAALTSEFDPVKFSAERWVKFAKQAGAKYIVITSKHHDGFCMFNTKATDYNVVQDTPWHRDPLLALSQACRRNGIKFCTYYSIMDWHSPDQEPASPDPEHPTYNPTHFAAGKKDAYIQYMETQLKELVTQYRPTVLWFDGEWMNGWTDQDGWKVYDYLRTLDPSLIINGRLGNRNTGPGDYGTPEQYIPPNGLPGRDWETCMTMNDTWGYRKDDHDWKSTKTLVHDLIDCASKGGNYLLNVGPTGEGLIPAASVERLKQIGKWMRVNGQAIYGTTASPFTEQLPWGRCTQRVTAHGTTLYLHVWDWPSDGRLLVPGLKNKISKAYLLEANFLGWHKGLATANGTDGVTVFLPKSAPDEISSTVVLEFDGAPEIGAVVTP